LGYISVDGTADLNIIIRTAVVTPANVTVNAGGALTFLSSTDEEYDEMVLKVRAVTRSMGRFNDDEEEEKGAGSEDVVVPSRLPPPPLPTPRMAVAV